MNSTHDYDFRGCGVTVPKKHEDVLMRGLFSTRAFNSIFDTKQETKKNEDEGEVADGNLCNINNNNNNVNTPNESDSEHGTGSNNITHGAPKEERIFSPLYELMAPKKKSNNGKGNDDDWLFMIAGDNKADTNSKASAMATAAAMNEAVQHLSRGDVEKAVEILSNLHLNEETSSIEAMKMLKRSVSVVQNVKTKNEVLDV